MAISKNAVTSKYTEYSYEKKVMKSWWNCLSADIYFYIYICREVFS